jgi:hypothetical protein
MIPTVVLIHLQVDDFYRILSVLSVSSVVNQERCIAWYRFPALS